MSNKIINIYTSIFHADFAKNIFWGLIGKISETLFLSLFFIIISRNYVKSDFATFLIANNVYQLVVGFSTMGLGDWFIREIGKISNRHELIYKFVKIQIGLGLLFYLFNIALAFVLYHHKNLRWICIVLGLNIIFDNIIYALRSLNIAEFKQKKSAIIMAIDGFFKLLISCLLFLYSLPILSLCFLLTIVRLFTLNLFLQKGSSIKLDFLSLWKFKITWEDIKKHVLNNWRFIIIVGLSIVFWRSATIIISKYLSNTDVAVYEVSNKIFSVFVIIPIVACTSIYPQFIKYLSNNNKPAIEIFYNNIYFVFTIFCILSYAFIQSYADVIVPFLFGQNYINAAYCLKEIFLTFLVFPTALLQANLLVALKLEKLDMYFNLVALIIYFVACFIGLHFFKSLDVINYSIFGAFLCFHIMQNIILNKFKFATLKNSISFYAILIAVVFLYNLLLKYFNPNLVFIYFFILITFLVLIYFTKQKRFSVLIPKIFRF